MFQSHPIIAPNCSSKLDGATCGGLMKTIEGCMMAHDSLMTKQLSQAFDYPGAKRIGSKARHKINAY